MRISLFLPSLASEFIPSFGINSEARDFFFPEYTTMNAQLNSPPFLVSLIFYLILPFNFAYMASPPIEELSTEELQEKRKTYRNMRLILLIIFGGLILVILLYGFLGTDRSPRNFTPLMGLVVGLFSVNILSVNIKKIDKELNKRGEG